MSGKDERPKQTKNPTHYIEGEIVVYDNHQQQRGWRGLYFYFRDIKKVAMLIAWFLLWGGMIYYNTPSEVTVPYYVIECEVVSEVSQLVDIYIIKDGNGLGYKQEDSFGTMTNNKINSSMKVRDDLNLRITFRILDTEISAFLETGAFDAPLTAIVYGIEYNLHVNMLFDGYG